MSISTQIERITSARNKIRTWMVGVGLAQTSDSLTTLANSLEDVVNQGSPNAEIREGEAYTIQAGYYTGGTVQAVQGGGSYNLQQKTVTPTKSQQSVTSDEGYYGLSEVTVNAIPSQYQDVSSVTAGQGDVLATKVFVDSTGTPRTGTMLNNGASTQTLTGLNTDMSVTLGAGYYSSIKVTLTNDIETQLSAI